MNSTNTNVIKASEWTKGENGYHPCRVVIWKRDTETQNPYHADYLFVTHIEVKQENGELSYNWGHYDLSLESAIEDFNNRIKDLVKI